MEKSKKVSSEILGANPWWKYVHDKYSLPSGKEGDYYYGETAGLGCSMVIPILDDGRLLLTVQFRYLRDKRSVEFPCGGLSGPEETPSAAAVRELLEETGYKSSDIIKIGEFDGLNGLFKDTTHVFIARELERVGEQNLDESEDIELIYRRPDEFEDIIKRGEIWDGQTLAAWAIVRDNL